MLKSILPLAGIAATLALAPAALAQDEDRCVQIRQVSGYSVIDDQNVLIRMGASRHVLVTTRTRCSGLRQGIQIGTSFGDNTRICRPSVEHIVPEDGWRCQIDSMQEVDSEEQAREIIAARG
jgi:hypothetical protein